MSKNYEWNTVRVYSIPQSVFEKSKGGIPMLCRTPSPVSLQEGLKEVKRLNDKGHIVSMQREGSKTPQGYVSE